MVKPRKRCPWCGDDPLYVAYHDREWGRVVRDDTRLFEQLTLEGAQAGLSWLIVLRKREGYRRAFVNFDPAKVARFGPAKVRTLLADPGIVRHRGKILSAISNARIMLSMQKEFGSFYAWLKLRSKGHPDLARRRPRKMSDLPGASTLAHALSKELRKRGMRFVGPTIVHAFLQATGVVDEHLSSCWRARPTNTKL